MVARSRELSIKPKDKHKGSLNGKDGFPTSGERSKSIHSI